MYSYQIINHWLTITVYLKNHTFNFVNYFWTISKHYPLSSKRPYFSSLRNISPDIIRDHFFSSLVLSNMYYCHLRGREDSTPTRIFHFMYLAKTKNTFLTNKMYGRRMRLSCLGSLHHRIYLREIFFQLC